MQVAICLNNLVTKFGDHTELFPDFSFPASGPDAQFLKEHSAYPVVMKATLDRKTQKIESVPPFFKDGEVFGVRVVNKSPEELDADKKRLADEVINHRNYMLSTSDWTRLDDVTVDKEAWAIYRQALRDVTKQPGYPTSVIWPIAPKS
jgi:hypothetical protein